MPIACSETLYRFFKGSELFSLFLFVIKILSIVFINAYFIYPAKSNVTLTRH